MISSLAISDFCENHHTPFFHFASWLNSVQPRMVQLSLAQLGSTRLNFLLNLAQVSSAHLRLAQFGSAWLNLAQLSSTWLNLAQLCSTRLNLAQLSSTWHSLNRFTLLTAQFIKSSDASLQCEWNSDFFKSETSDVCEFYCKMHFGDLWKFRCQ